MATDDLINTSIDEYLISLANSINHAQRHISQLRVAGRDGQAAITYQLPKVDFELKLLFQLDRQRPPSGSWQRDVAKGEGGGFLEARPLSADAGDAERAAAASTIKGTFVAVPVHGGTPPPVITVSWTQVVEVVAGTYKITVTVRSNIGEALAGREVQFNLDKDLAKKLNPLWSLETNLSKILPQTRLRYGVRNTNEVGEATNELTIGDLVKDVRAPVVIDVLGVTKTMVFSGATGEATPGGGS